MKNNNRLFKIAWGSALALAIMNVQAATNLIPNGTFQMYKADDLSVTADFPAGNNFSGAFEGVVTASGTVAYSDGTTGTTEIVMPGWETSPNGGGGAGLFNRGLGRGLDNNTTMETFAGWGGSNGDLIRTPEGSLGTAIAASYTLSAEVNGAASGDPSAILSDLRLDLLADGVVIPPTSSIPPNTADNTWSFWTNTYDAATLASLVGQELTIEFGTNPSNTAPGRASWDNISLTATPEFNGTFQMYKAGDLSVTADFPTGNNFSGAFEGVVTAAGTVAYSDGTTGTTEILMPGWETSPNGGGGAGLFNRGLGRGLDNNTTMETFAGWGGSNGDLIRTQACALGAAAAGGYILSAEVNGASSGDPSEILSDLRLDLLADGVVIPPTSSTPPNTANNTWSFWTHTYDSATLAPFVGQDLTIEFGTNPTNTAPGRASWDNISLTAIPDSSALVLTILPGSETPGTFDFSWKGKAGKRYDLVTSTDLSMPLMDWPIYSTYFDIAAAPVLNELIGVPSDSEKRFFAVIEKD